MKVEEYIKRYTRGCSNKLAYKENDDKPMYHPWLTPENAEEVAMIARKETITKTCEWLKALNNSHEIMSYTDSHTVETDELIQYFKNFMEGRV